MTVCDGDPDTVVTEGVSLLDEVKDGDGVPSVNNVEDDDGVVERDGLTERVADMLWELETLCDGLTEVDWLPDPPWLAEPD